MRPVTSEPPTAAFNCLSKPSVQLKAVAKIPRKSEHDKVMKDYEEYVNLVLEPEEFVVGLS